MVKFFYQPMCVKCPPAKRVVEELKKRGVQVEEYDVSTANGLAEAVLNGVLSSPTLLVAFPDKEPEIYTNDFQHILTKEFL